MDIADIAVGIRSGWGAERGLITGGAGSGKSTLAEFLFNEFMRKYPTAHLVIADSKPRFRAEFELSGLKADKRYKSWGHGPTIPGSVVGDLSRDDAGMGQAWKLGARVVILQTDLSSERASILRALDHFYRQARKGRPSLVYMDELADFFGPNGQPAAGLPADNRDIVTRINRNGRELDLAFLASMQRPIGIPPIVRQELNKLYLFREDNVKDMDSLYDMGVPETIVPPSEDFEFVYWQKRSGQPPKKLRLTLNK